MIIYLAGPDVFHPQEETLGILKKELCKKYGFDSIFPTDSIDDSIWNLNVQEQARLIREACIDSMNKSDIILANMTPFRGAGMDGGTAFEMGYMDALGKPVYAYSHDPRNYLEKIGFSFENDLPFDENGFLIENFNTIDNCMMTYTVFKYMKKIPVTSNSNFFDLSAMEEALRIIKNQL